MAQFANFTILHHIWLPSFWQFQVFLRPFRHMLESCNYPVSRYYTINSAVSIPRLKAGDTDGGYFLKFGNTTPGNINTSGRFLIQCRVSTTCTPIAKFPMNLRGTHHQLIASVFLGRHERNLQVGVLFYPVDFYQMTEIRLFSMK